MVLAMEGLYVLLPLIPSVQVSDTKDDATTTNAGIKKIIATY
jgi:hypothetical protein